MALRPLPPSCPTGVAVTPAPLVWVIPRPRAPLSGCPWTERTEVGHWFGVLGAKRTARPSPSFPPLLPTCLPGRLRSQKGRGGAHLTPSRPRFLPGGVWGAGSRVPSDHCVEPQAPPPPRGANGRKTPLVLRGLAEFTDTPTRVRTRVPIGDAAPAGSRTRDPLTVSGTWPRPGRTDLPVGDRHRKTQR